MLMKLTTTGWQFYQHFMSSFCTNVLPLQHKITKPNCKHIKDAQNTSVQKKSCLLNVGEIDTWLAKTKKLFIQRFKDCNLRLI